MGLKYLSLYGYFLVSRLIKLGLEILYLNKSQPLNIKMSKSKNVKVKKVIYIYIYIYIVKGLGELYDAIAFSNYTRSQSLPYNLDPFPTTPL